MSVPGELNDESAESGNPEPRVSMKIHGGPWVAAPIRAIADRRLSPTARLVFQILMANANDTTGACFPGFERIAVYVGLENARSLYRPMKELENAGYITRERRPGYGGYRTSDEYELFPDNPGAPKIADLNAEAERRRQLAIKRQAEARSRKRSLGPSARSSNDQARDPVTTKRAESHAELPEVELPEVELPNARGDFDLNPPEAVAASGDARVSTTNPAPVPSVPSEPIARETEQEPEPATLFEPAGPTPDGVARGAAPPEAKSKGKRAAPAGKDDPDFERFWGMAPAYALHHGSRQKAYDAWKTARRTGVTAGAILAAWEAYVAEWATWAEGEQQFIPAEKTWLGEERWKIPVKPRHPKGVRAVPGRRQTDEERKAVGEQASASYERKRAEWLAQQGRSGRPGALPVREVVASEHTPMRRPA